MKVATLKVEKLANRLKKLNSKARMTIFIDLFIKNHNKKTLFFLPNMMHPIIAPPDCVIGNTMTTISRIRIQIMIESTPLFLRRDSKEQPIF